MSIITEGKEKNLTNDDFKSRKSIFKLKNYYDNKSDCINCKALTD